MLPRLLSMSVIALVAPAGCRPAASPAPAPGPASTPPAASPSPEAPSAANEAQEEHDGLTLGLYDPALDRWWNASGGYATYDFSLVWTGTELIAWGGFDGTNDTPEGTRLPIPAPP